MPAVGGYRLTKVRAAEQGLLTIAGRRRAGSDRGTAVSTWQAIRATQAEGLARNAVGRRKSRRRTPRRDQLRLTEAAEDQAMHRLYDARLAQARAGSLSRRVGQRFDSLDAVAQALKIARDLNLGEERLLELRNAAIACLALPDLRIAKEWNGWPTGTWSVDFDSTLERYARVDRQGDVHIHRVADDSRNLPPSGNGTGRSLGVRSAPMASSSLCRHRDRRLKVWKLAGPEPVVIVEELSCTGGVAFSPDSRRLAIGHADGSIRLYDLPSGRQLKQLEGVPRQRCDGVPSRGPTVGG